MNYSEYKKLKETLQKNLEKLYNKRDVIEEFMKKAGDFQTAKAEVAHIQELINNLEEAYNACEWLMGEC